MARDLAISAEKNFARFLVDGDLLIKTVNCKALKNILMLLLESITDLHF